MIQNKNTPTLFFFDSEWTKNQKHYKLIAGYVNIEFQYFYRFTAEKKPIPNWNIDDYVQSVVNHFSMVYFFCLANGRTIDLFPISHWFAMKQFEKLKFALFLKRAVINFTWVFRRFTNIIKFKWISDKNIKLLCSILLINHNHKSKDIQQNQSSA